VSPLHPMAERRELTESGVHGAPAEKDFSVGLGLIAYIASADSKFFTCVLKSGDTK